MPQSFSPVRYNMSVSPVDWVSPRVSKCAVIRWLAKPKRRFNCCTGLIAGQTVSVRTTIKLSEEHIGLNDWITHSLRRTTEGFYDTALNEASESELRKLYQCHGPLPKSQGVPEGPLRKNHISRRLTLSDLASKVGKIAIGQILVANKDVHWVGIIDIQVHLEIGIETEQKTPFINM